MKLAEIQDGLQEVLISVILLIDVSWFEGEARVRLVPVLYDPAVHVTFAQGTQLGIEYYSERLERRALPVSTRRSSSRILTDP